MKTTRPDNLRKQESEAEKRRRRKPQMRQPNQPRRSVPSGRKGKK